MLMTSVGSAAAITGKPGETFFRYRSAIGAKVDQGGPVDVDSKSVTAFYVAGVGMPFEELLPLKPEWESDAWRIVSGALPEGIVFDPATRKFTGTATNPSAGTAVRLEGFDSSGNSVARATVTFDVVVVQGTPVPVTLYAHTGKFKVDELPLPSDLPEGVAIESWAKVQALPGGVDLESRYVQGAPTKAGTYRLLITGRDYKGDVVATYFGKYLVEDGPTFNRIADMVEPLPQLELSPGLQMSFGAPSPFAVNHAIDPVRGVRYYVEKKDAAQPFPGSISSNDRPLDLRLHGTVTDPYKTSTIRFKAVDVDGTVGYSNWFTFGSGDPQPICNPFATAVIPLVTGVDISVPVPKPFGVQGDVQYSLVSGTLPEGLAFDEETGLISGRALNVGDDQDITVVVDVTNGGNVVSSRECLYTVQVRAGGVAVGDLTDPQERHVRAGDYYDGVVGITGGIPDFDLSITDPAALPYLSLTSPTLNQERVDVSGQTADPGSKVLGLTLSNGDGSTHSGSVTLEVHGELSIGPVADIKAKRMAEPATIARLPFDEDTVIPDVDGSAMPKFTYTNLQALPHGIVIDGDGFVSGATTEPAGTYGPFTATMTDHSGETVTSEEFSIVVEDRDPIVLNLNAEHRFSVEWDRKQTLDSFTVVQPSAARGLEQAWSLAAKDGSTVPSWLSIDPKNGDVTAEAGIPYAARGTYGPFVATVTDTDGSTASKEFTVVLQDWQSPTQRMASVVSGTVAGTDEGETRTVVSFPDLRSLIDPLTVIGGVDEVEFVSSSPAAPGGMAFNPATGAFEGVPTEAFEGSISVQFKDARGRTGTLVIDARIRDYPFAFMEDGYVLPRLARAELLDAPIMPTRNDGYWGRAEWSVDTDRGTDISAFGLGVDTATGALTGTTDAAEGQVISGIVLKSTSLGAGGELLRNWTRPFAITVAAAAPIAVAYEPAVSKFLVDEATMALRGREAATPVVKGSYKAPLVWSADAASEALLAAAGLSLDPATGAVVGSPSRLGRWDIAVTATDAEGRFNATAAPLTVLSTLDGAIMLGQSSGSFADWPEWPQGWKETAGKGKLLRVDEPFRTPEVPVVNAVAPVAFNTHPSPTEAGLVFNQVTGEYVAGSRFATPGKRHIVTDARDADDRTLGVDRIGIHFDVQAPLSMTLPSIQKSLVSRQLSGDMGDPIDVTFTPYVENRIGTLSYSVEGDLPGTAVAFDGSTYTWIAGGSSRSATTASELPDDAIVFDRTALTLKGVPSKTGTFAFRLVARDSHADGYLQDTSSRLANNTSSQEIVVNVQPSAAFALKSSENPKGVVVPGGNGIMSVTPQYAAYGKASAFSVTGTLPPGITVRTDGKGAYFSGKFTGTVAQMGRYDGITVSATDALGRTASLSVSFNVFLSTDAIGLEMADVKTKVGHPFSMQADADNYFGGLRFYSYDLSGQFGGQVSLDQSTGELAGTVAAAGDHTVNVYVTDSTNRVTSRPVKVSVVPAMRVTVPEQVEIRQGDALNRTILTDYKLGTVVYEKVDPENWPTGFILDEATGVISNANVTAAAGTYPGLRIRATDTFQSGGMTRIDNQVSNVFSIVVSEVDARPVISDLNRTILGHVGAQITYLQPIVVDDVKNHPWTYGGTTFTASHDLTQYGLSFNPATGRISGTPTESFVIRDFVITVKSSAGDEDATAPFWLGVSPEGSIVAAAGQQTVHNLRVGDTLELDAPIFDNTGGNVSYTISGLGRGSFDSETGAYEHPAYSASEQGRKDIAITVTDEFGRSAAIGHLVMVRPALVIAISEKTYEAGYAFTSNAPVVTGGTLGQLRFSSPDIPPFLSINPQTGVVSGTPPASITDDIVIHIAVKDLMDGAEAEGVLTMPKEPDRKVLRLRVHASTHGHACFGHVKLFADGIDVFPEATLTGVNSNYGQVDVLKDPRLTHTTDLYCVNVAGGDNGIDIKIPATFNVNQLVVYQRNDVYQDAYFKDISLNVKHPDGTLTQLFRSTVDDPRSGTFQAFNF